MTTHTIEVADIDDDLLRRLDERAQQQGLDRTAYMRGLLRRAVEEEEITEFINAQIHEARREHRASQAATEAAHQEAA